MTGQEQAARTRVKHALARLQETLVILKSHVEADLPTSETRQVLMSTANDVVQQLAIVDAFRYEREQKKAIENGGAVALLKAKATGWRTAAEDLRAPCDGDYDIAAAYEECADELDGVIEKLEESL